MEQVNKLREQVQVGLNRLREVGESQPKHVKLWGVTAGSALVGGVAVAALAKGVVTVLATLATPPVALSLGAAAGGALGWSYMQTILTTVDKQADNAAVSTEMAPENATVSQTPSAA
jgi:hypothetical protein